MKALPLIITILIAGHLSLHAQNTITGVLNNTVQPCSVTIGTAVTVADAQQLRNALDQANSSGGNMTILLRDGVYRIASTSWYPYITAGNLVIRSVSGNRDAVMVSGEGMRDVSPDVENGFYFTGSNVTIADLTIREVGNHCIAVDGASSDIVVHNVRFQDACSENSTM